MQDVSRCVEIVETQRFTRKMLSKSSKQNKKGETDKVSQVQRLSMPGKRWKIVVLGLMWRRDLFSEHA